MTAPKPTRSARKVDAKAPDEKPLDQGTSQETPASKDQPQSPSKKRTNKEIGDQTDIEPEAAPSSPKKRRALRLDTPEVLEPSDADAKARKKEGKKPVLRAISPQSDAPSQTSLASGADSVAEIKQDAVVTRRTRSQTASSIGPSVPVPRKTSASTGEMTYDPDPVVNKRILAIFQMGRTSDHAYGYQAMPSDGIWTWSEDNLQWIYRKNATSPPYKILLIGRVKSKFFKLTRVETLPKRVSVNLDLVGAAQTKFAKALLKVHSKNVSNEYPDIQVACWSETDSDGEVLPFAQYWDSTNGFKKPAAEDALDPRGAQLAVNDVVVAEAHLTKYRDRKNGSPQKSPVKKGATEVIVAQFTLVRLFRLKQGIPPPAEAEVDEEDWEIA